MLLLIRTKLRKGVRITNTEDPDILGITLDREYFGLQDNLHVWFTYAPPLNSTYNLNKENTLSILEKYLTGTSGKSLIMGDLNGKTSTRMDYLEDENDKYSPITEITDYLPGSPNPRNSMDRHPVDHQGKTILELCKTFNLKILN